MSALMEASQDAAEIAVVEAELGGNLPGRRLLARCEFVEHAGFGQRVWGFQKVVAQHANPARVGPVEAAHGADALVQGLVRHARQQRGG